MARRGPSNVEGSFGNKIIGKAYEEPKKLAKRYAGLDLPVLFVGESGSGKELFAQYYMEHSPLKGERRSINCAAFTTELLNSEVFGHERGAFTGADKRRSGLARTCDGGILFLDEIGDASSEFQAAILRITDGLSYRSLGSDDESRCNTRIIAATNHPTKVRPELQGRFQIVFIPPLQPSDIRELASHFLETHSKGRWLKEAAIDYLRNAPMDGQVRGLKRRCEYLYAEDGDSIFQRAPAARPPEYCSFNYERFREECRIWYKYVQPLIDKCEFEFKYTYMPLNEDSFGWTLSEHQFVLENGFLNVLSTGVFFNENLRDQFVKLMEVLVQGRLISSFLMYVAEKIENKNSIYSVLPIPYYLFDLPWKVSINQFGRAYWSFMLDFIEPDKREELSGKSKNYFQEQVRKWKNDEESHRIWDNALMDCIEDLRKPDVSPLFLLPFNEANIHFEIAYWDYLWRTTSDDATRARVSGMKESGMRSAIQRLRKKTGD